MNVSTPDLFEVSASILDGRSGIGDHHPLNMGRELAHVDAAAGVRFFEAFGNVIGVDTDEGLVLVDASGPLHARAIHESVRDWTTAALHTAIYTHGHVDHIYAVAEFERADDRAARVVGHEAVADRFRRYERTNGYNAIINQRQFQLGGPYFPRNYRYPDVTYRDTLDLHVGGIELQLRHDRGETDDGTWVYLPDTKVLCTGDLFIWASPNCGNPQKAQRYCDEWAIALRKMADLGAEVLLPGHGLPIAGADRIAGALRDTARYLESLFDQTIEMMNGGARLDEIIHTVRPPDDLIDRPFLQPVYDEPEFVVRGIWRLYGGWYDGNPAHLKPPADADLAAELTALIGSADRLAERAIELSAIGDHRLASQLVELATQAAPDSTEVRAARATVFGARAKVERSTMAKGVYSWAAKESGI